MSADELMFRLEVEDDWPPVAKECLVCTVVSPGYRIEVPPFFIKEMSVGDLITIQRDSEGDVVSWSHLVKSSRSTLWLMAYGDYSVEGVLDGLKRLGCNVEDLKQFRYFSIDVPEDCSLADLDQCLDGLDEENSALAYPSFRH
ncbi:DUF4265 domain-containing protein [Xanthomonas perforans]|uniref:DUF4265 domain-containing protein n=1 Tax=Xanthomonas euvesicatoria TaxID=456327 RepID=A0AAX4FM05_XANEU|nr:MULTISPECIES: DUF4265 domain-containing protein [Xanthomonas]MBV6860061.1 DUF4265 domain-containing protein [Xanthomonas campestris pv. zingibericola]WOP49142.1 DUF4265 domain-containing protein [Xanthomonas euvesicatoria]WOP51557.1 DUF4265 domain-containing protein [Xanthomonas euvesicatoria]WOP57601.1 DUF4265 domain-containing protein [Xanthomonas euvesicatoria]